MSLCRDMMPPWEIKAEMDRLTTENERLGRDYQTARDAHDKLLLEIERLRAALEQIADTDPDDGTEWFHSVARAALGGGCTCIRADQLPIEVMNEFHAALLHGESYAEAFAAALNAWPGMALDGPVTANGRWLVPPVVVLPLPQEVSDE